MRLKSIKLAGFKSFVDPTTVTLPGNLCAVVGPNGCGKSNIIDAVRWVMGESSAKNLRGENMTDVIFNGSGARKPVGQASIELVFDNSEDSGKLVGEYAAFNEISIRRKVTRDGQNVYYLNGTKCRRRDITDIFLGTGLGPRSYAIIEQGMISRLIEAKPEELRVYIEEAAGISKYKERRRDTENRIRRTHENLERLTDIREELERQLQHLKRQAAAAERYTEYKKEERVLKAQLQAVQWKKLDEQTEQRNLAVSSLETHLEAIITEQREAITAIETKRQAYTDAGDHFNQVQGRFYSVGAEIARNEQTIQHRKERNRQLAADLEQTEYNLEQATEHLRDDKQKLEAWEEELLQVEPELEMQQAAADDAADELHQAEERMNHWQQQWDQFNQTAAQPRQRAEVQQSRIQHAEKVLQSLNERVKRLQGELEGLRGVDGEDDIELLSEQIAELELLDQEQQARLHDNAERLDLAREEAKQQAAALDNARTELQRLRGKQASLEALQQAAQGAAGGEVQRWLNDHSLATHMRLADSLVVDEGWEKAVETVLGECLQAVVVDDIATHAPAMASLRKGSLQLVQDSPLIPSRDHGLPALSDKVSGSANLLHGVYAADTLDAALAVSAFLQGSESIVTRDGHWLGVNWIRVIAARDASEGVMQRKQDLDAISASIAIEEARVNECDTQLLAVQATISQCEQHRDDIQRERADINKKQGDLTAQLSAKRVRIEQSLVQRERLSADIADAKQQYVAENEALAESRMILQEALELMESDTDQREALLRQRDERRTALDEVRQRARHLRDMGHQLAMRHQSLLTQLASVKQSCERSQQQVAQLAERRRDLQASLSEEGNPIEDIQETLEALLQQRMDIEVELDEARRSLETLEQDMREVERKRNDAEQRANTVRNQLEKVRLDAQSVDVRRASLQQQLEESGFKLEAVLDILPEDATEDAWSKQLEDMAARINRLGAINLAAIDEYKSQAERKEYLDAQNSELLEALETLENAIKKIDRETRTRFRETFDKVNNGLKELFPRVFGGGHAYLELTGDDMLNTGIAIMARPPGKRNSTIHLLSGGEKALTAIALVFSIFRLNPAPFCMLDEVDAPLDDANVGRYARMVSEMSEHVQFIYITHNKIAMEMASHLLGVTMHEPGVSRLVTVDVEEAAELAAM
jgi:chromosome segregation protein